MDPQEVQQNLSDYLSSSENYKLHAKPIKIEINEQNNTEIMQSVSKAVIDILKNQSLSALTKLNAVRLVKECDKMINYTESYLLSIFKEIAMYKKEIQMDDRGKTYFEGHENSQEIQILGNSFLRLILECLFVWAQIYRNKKFNNVFKELKYEHNVKFPQSLNYFKDQNHLVQEEQDQHEEDLRQQQIIKQQKNKEQNGNSNNHDDDIYSPTKKTPAYNEQQMPKRYESNSSQNNQLYSTQNSVLNSYIEENQRNSEKYKLRSAQSNLRPQSPNNSNIHNNSAYSSRKNVANTLMISRANPNTSRASIQDEKKLNRPIDSSKFNNNSANQKFNNKFDLNIVSKYGVSTPNQQQKSSLQVNQESVNKPGYFSSTRSTINRVHNVNDNDNFNSNDKGGQNLEDYLQIIDELTQERDKYKALYEQDNANLRVREKQLKDLQQEKEELEQENIRLQKNSVSQGYNNQY